MAKAAEELHPTDADAAIRWREERLTDLYLGDVPAITWPLERAGLTTEAGYFRNHTRRMQYQEFHEQDYPIGSGTVESAIKRFKHRVWGAGMSWSRPALDRMLVLRAAYMADTFDALWASAN